MKEPTVMSIIEEVAGQICDKYCKYPDIYKPEHIPSIDDDYMGRMFQDKCRECPLKRLVRC